MNGNQNIVFNCDKCTATFGFESLLEIHKKLPAYKNNGVQHPCDKCNNKYCTVQMLQKHTYENHKSDSETKTSNIVKIVAKTPV